MFLEEGLYLFTSLSLALSTVPNTLNKYLLLKNFQLSEPQLPHL